MLKNITSFGRSGVADWVIQRVTAVILFFYLLWLALYCSFNSVDYASWAELFSLFPVKVASFFALVSLLIHAWIGIWTVLTDYIKPWFLRLVLEITVICSLGIFLLWGVHILWS